MPTAPPAATQRALEAIYRNAYRIRTVLPEKFASLTLRLYPGRYTIWCTLGDHRALGMVAALTVRK